MDSRGRAYYIKAAAAAAATGDARDYEDPAELGPEAVSKKKLVVEAQGPGLGCDADGGAAAVRDDLTCLECGKVFLSDKAMYGHLRAHPQRKNKGAARPAATAANDAFVAAGVKARPWKVPRKEAVLDDPHPGRSPVTGKRGRPASSASSGSAPEPPALSRLQLVLTDEEEAAMTLLDIASGRQRSLDHQPRQPVHVADDDAALPEPASHQMPSVEQGALAVAPHHAAPGVQQLSVPDHTAGADAEQRTWEAEKPALVEHVFGIVKEHVAAVTAEQQTPEAKTPVKLGPVTEVVPVLGDKNGHAYMPVSPGGTTKKPLKRRFQDVEQPPAAPLPPADFKPPPVRRIPSPASKKKYECSECHKTFSSHQALGGHVAAHKRQKKSCVEQQQHEVLAAAAQVARHNFLAHQRPAGVVVDAPVVAAGGGDLGPLGEEGLVGPPPPAPAPAPPQHQCVRCPMIFPTGQALGGHMRKHFLESKEQDLASANATSAPSSMMANAAPVPPTTANGAPVPPPIAGATPPAPPIARAAPPPPMDNGVTPATPVGSAAAAPPAGNAAPGPQPGVNLFDLNELPKEDAGENHQP